MQLSIDTASSIRFAVALRAGRRCGGTGSGGEDGPGRDRARFELDRLMGSSAFRAYILHRSRGRDGAAGAASFLHEVEEFWRGATPPRRRDWDALAELSGSAIRRRHRDLRRSLTPDRIASRVLPWIDAAGCILDLALIVDPQCPSVSFGHVALIDVLDCWSGAIEPEAVVDRGAAAVYRCAASSVFRRAFELRGSFRGWGDIAALVLLHRLVTTGIVCREFSGWPREAHGLQAPVLAEARARCPDPLAWLRATLDRLRRGEMDPARASTLLARLDRGSPSPAAVIGMGLLESASLTRERADAWVRDPRGFPQALVRHGFPEDLAAWCAGLGEEPRIDAVGSPAIHGAWGGVRVISLPCRGRGGGGDPAGDGAGRSMTVAVAIAAGGIHDPDGCEGLAHLLEHLIRDRLARAGFRGMPTQAFVEKEVALYLVSMGEGEQVPLSNLLRGVLDPLDAEEDAVERARGEIEIEFGLGASDSLGAIDLAVERDLLRPPYGRPVRGSLRSFPRLTRERARAFHRRCYRPGRTVVAAVGGHLEGARLETAGRPSRSFVPIRAEGRRALWTWRVHPDGGFWVLARRVPGKDDAAYRAVAVLGRIVAGLLHDRYRDRVRLASTYFVGSGIWRFVAGREAGIVPADLITLLHEDVRALADAGLRAASRAEGDVYAALSARPECCAVWLAAGGLLVPERRPSIEGERSAFGSLDPAEIRAWGERLLVRPAIPVDART